MDWNIPNIEPTTLTVSKLKALLSEEGVTLPTTKEPKSAYVDLFNEHKSKLLQRIHQSQEATQSLDITPRKRKQRHSINVFQSGAKKQPIDEEEQKKPKKRKSLVHPQEANQIDQPPHASAHSNGTQTRHIRYLQPTPIPQPTPPIPQPAISPPRSRFQPGISQLPPVPQIPPRHSFQPSQQPQSHLRKYQLPPTLFQPQQKPTQASVKQQSTYISPLYFSNPPTAPQSLSRTSTASQPMYNATRAYKPLSPSQLPLPPPPSPLPTPTQPRSPLPPPPSPLLTQQFASRSIPITTKRHSRQPYSVQTVSPYIYVFLVAVLWIIALAWLYSSIAAYFGSSLQFCDSELPSTSCVPCPQHGICKDGNLQCDTRYVRSGMQCIDDLEINLMAESISERINEIVMETCGKYQCGATPNNFVTVDELKMQLANAYESDKFREAFMDALRKINSNPRYSHLRASNDQFSSDKITLSLPCMAKLALYEQLPFLSLLTVGVVLALGIRYWRKSAARRTKDVNDIVAMVLAELQKETEGIVVDHLRDKLLYGRSERAKGSIWPRVQAVVQADSRVGEFAGFKEGAQVTTWQWADK